MANEPLSSSMKVSPDLLESLGEYSQAMKMVKGELRELNKETRAMEKGGFGFAIPEEKRARLSDLEMQLERLNVNKLSENAKRKIRGIVDEGRMEKLGVIRKEIQDKKRAIAIVDKNWAEKQKTIRQEIRDANNTAVDSHFEPQRVLGGISKVQGWSRGRIDLQDLARSTKALENIGWKMYERSQSRTTGGYAERMLGIRIVKEGMALGRGMQTIAAMAGPAAIGVAAGLGAWKLGSMYFERHMAESRVSAIPATLLNDTLFADRFGQRFDEKFALDAMVGMGYAGRRAEASAYRASPYERLLNRFGFAPGDAILQRKEEAQRTEYARRVMTTRYGTKFLMATSYEEIKKKYSHEIERLVRREYLTTDTILTGIKMSSPGAYALVEAYEYLHLDNLRYDSTQIQVQAFQKKAMEAFELERENEMKIWRGNPANILKETMTRTILSAARDYERNRYLQWNKY